MAMMSVAPGFTGTGVQYTAYAMGVTIPGPETDGWVVVALPAFALGIVMTIAIQKRRASR